MYMPEITQGRKLILLAGFIMTVLLVGHELKLHLPGLEAWIATLGVYAPAAYVVLFAALAPFFVSIDALCFGAGVLFPLAVAELTVVIATYLAAALIFYLGRDLMRDRVVKLLAGHEHFNQLDRLLNSNNALKLMFLLRLTPLPFAMFSYALAVTEVKFWPYLAATTGILLYNGALVYLGYTTKHFTGLAAGAPQTGSMSHTMLAVGVLVLIALVVLITRLASKTLSELDAGKA